MAAWRYHHNIEHRGIIPIPLRGPRCGGRVKSIGRSALVYIYIISVSLERGARRHGFEHYHPSSAPSRASRALKHRRLTSAAAAPLINHFASAAPALLEKRRRGPSLAAWLINAATCKTYRRKTCNRNSARAAATRGVAENAAFSHRKSYR